MYIVSIKDGTQEKRLGKTLATENSNKFLIVIDCYFKFVLVPLNSLFYALSCSDKCIL